MSKSTNLKFLLQQPYNLVLDGGVFSMIQEDRHKMIFLIRSRSKITIMTPHRGEFKRVFLVTENARIGEWNDSAL